MQKMENYYFIKRNKKPTNFHATRSRKKFRNNFFHLPGSQLFDCRRIPPQIFAIATTQKIIIKKQK